MLTEKIIGTWELKSWTYVNDKNEEVSYLGKDPVGILTYSKNSRMGVQIMKGGRRKFTSGDLMDGTREEINEAFTSFFAYFGTWEEKEEGILTHHISGSNFPNWTGESEIRYGVIHGDELTLSAPAILPDGLEVIFEVKWKKTD